MLVFTISLPGEKFFFEKTTHIEWSVNVREVLLLFLGDYIKAFRCLQFQHSLFSDSFSTTTTNIFLLSTMNVYSLVKSVFTIIERICFLNYYYVGWVSPFRTFSGPFVGG